MFLTKISRTCSWMSALRSRVSSWLGSLVREPIKISIPSQNTTEAGIQFSPFYIGSEHVSANSSKDESSFVTSAFFSIRLSI